MSIYNSSYFILHSVISRNIFLVNLVSQTRNSSISNCEWFTPVQNTNHITCIQLSTYKQNGRFGFEPREYPRRTE